MGKAAHLIQTLSASCGVEDNPVEPSIGVPYIDWASMRVNINGQLEGI